MIRTVIDATIHFTHSPEEVAELSQAVIPMAEHIKAVASPYEQKVMRLILGCRDFRNYEAAAFKNMLMRASRHARANLSNYFPSMQQSIMGDAERLENAVKYYWETFQLRRDLLTPTR